MFKELENFTLSKPEIVNRIQSRRRDEESQFIHSESKCEICKKKNHSTDKCRWRNTNYTVKSNRKYMENKLAAVADNDESTDQHKSDNASNSNSTISSKSNNKSTGVHEKSKDKLVREEYTKSKVVEKPKGKSAEKNYKTEKSGVVRETSYESIAEKDRANIIEVKEIKVNSKELPDTICIVYDSGTGVGMVSRELQGVLQHIIKEEAYIIGQGGMIQHSVQAGINVFGKFRIIRDTGTIAISHSQAERNWQLHNPKPHHIQLREWPNKVRIGRVWDFYVNPEEFGDELPRMKLKRSEYEFLFWPKGAAITGGDKEESLSDFALQGV